MAGGVGGRVEKDLGTLVCSGAVEPWWQADLGVLGQVECIVALCHYDVFLRLTVLLLAELMLRQ